jgi:hypothetical protein
MLDDSKCRQDENIRDEFKASMPHNSSKKNEEP